MLRYDCECCASNRGASIQAPEPLEVSFWCPDGCEPVGVRKLGRFQQHLILLIFPFCGVRTKKEQAKLGCLSHVEALSQMQAARRSPLRTKSMPLVRIWRRERRPTRAESPIVWDEAGWTIDKGEAQCRGDARPRPSSMSTTGAQQADPQSTRERTGQKVPGNDDRGSYRSGDRAEKRCLWHPEKAGKRGPT